MTDEIVYVTVDGRKLEIDMSRFFDIDEANLTREFAQQAALFAYLSNIQAMAERDLADMSVKKEQVYASADEDFRAQLNETETKYTEPVIKSLVLQDKDYQKVDDRYRDAAHYANTLKLLVRAMAQRADMLISLGAHLRQEYEMTGIHIREKSYKDAVTIAKESLRKRHANGE